MPLPTLEKTWVFSTNNRITYTSLSGVCKAAMYGLKEQLKLMTGMTVKGSSNGTTAAMDAVDRWSSPGAIGGRVSTITTSGGSWIVLTSSVLGVDIAIAYIGNGDDLARISFSTEGFSLAGTPTQHPTSAADDTMVMHGSATGGAYFVGSFTSLDRLWSFGRATDGSCWYFIMVRNNALVGCSLLLMQRASASAVLAPATFDPPTWGYSAEQANNPALSMASLCAFNPTAGSSGVARANNGIGGGNVVLDQLNFSCEAFQNVINSALNVKYTFGPELQASSFLLQQLGLHSQKPTTRGKLCNVIDVWCGYNAATLGDTYPNDATRQFITLGGTSGLTLPWDGSVFVGA